MVEDNILQYHLYVTCYPGLVRHYIQDIGVVWFYSTYDFSFADYEKDLPMISESQEYIMQAKKEAAKFATAKTAINLKKYNTRNLQLGRL